MRYKGWNIAIWLSNSVGNCTNTKKPWYWENSQYSFNHTVFYLLLSSKYLTWYSWAFPQFGWKYYFMFLNLLISKHILIRFAWWRVHNTLANNIRTQLFVATLHMIYLLYKINNKILVLASHNRIKNMCFFLLTEVAKQKNILLDDS